MTDTLRAAPHPAPAFDLDRFLELPRVSGLALAPDGRRLVATVATVAPDGKKFVTALWELDPRGVRRPRRLTRSAPGESGAAFLPDGSLLFTSARTDPEALPDDDEPVTALWLLPPGGGEARLVASVPGGSTGVRTAREAGTVAFLADVFPGAETLAEDRETGKAREDAGVSAVLFESYPVRYWDHYLGPREPRLFASPPPDADRGRIEPLPSLTPTPGRALDVACFPDGRSVVCQRGWHGTPDEAPRVTLWLVDLAGGAGRDLLPGFDLWPHQPVWTPDGGAVLF